MHSTSWCLTERKLGAASGIVGCLLSHNAAKVSCDNFFKEEEGKRMGGIMCHF